MVFVKDTYIPTSYAELASAHEFKRTTQPFAKNLSYALFHKGIPPKYFPESTKRLTEFGQQFLERVQRNGGPLVDLGCGYVNPIDGNRYVPAAATLANVPYIGVDVNMQNHIDDQYQAPPNPTQSFLTWQCGQETYVKAGMLEYLADLKPLPEGKTYTFYLSGIQFAPDDTLPLERRDVVAHANREYMQACLREIARLEATVVFGYGVSAHEIRPEYLEEIGYRLDTFSSIHPRNLELLPELVGYDPRTNPNPSGLSFMHRIYTPNTI